MKRWFLSAAVVCCAVLLQSTVARDPVVHVLLQMPLLVAGGYFMPISRSVMPRELVAPIFIVTLFTILIWMLPRSVDAALLTWHGHVAKFVMLPALIGIPLRVTWDRLDPVLRGFCKAQAISMSLILAFLYTHAPLRVCNSYLIEDQQRLGAGFVVVGLAFVAVWAVPIFVPFSQKLKKGKDYELPYVG